MDVISVTWGDRHYERIGNLALVTCMGHWANFTAFHKLSQRRNLKLHTEHGLHICHLDNCVNGFEDYFPSPQSGTGEHALREID